VAPSALIVRKRSATLQSTAPPSVAASTMAASVDEVGRHGMVSRSRAARNAARAAVRSPAAADARPFANSAGAAEPSPSGASPDSFDAVVHATTGMPADFAMPMIRPRCVRRFAAAAVRSGESGGITVWPIICSISVRSASALRRKIQSTDCTIASPRAHRTKGSAPGGSVPEALIDAVPYAPKNSLLPTYSTKRSGSYASASSAMETIGKLAMAVVPRSTTSTSLPGQDSSSIDSRNAAIERLRGCG
jgi:hypothetical protein